MNMYSYKCCKSFDLDTKQISFLSSILKITAEENRLKILCILKNRKHCVCEIMKHVSLSQSLISHHLKDLKEAELINDKKHGLYVFYSLTPKGKKLTELLFQITNEKNND